MCMPFSHALLPQAIGVLLKDKSKPQLQCQEQGSEWNQSDYLQMDRLKIP